MKRLFCLLMAVCLLLGACAIVPQQPETKQYTATFLNLFDTVTTIVGKADSKESFEATAQ